MQSPVWMMQLLWLALLTLLGLNDAHAAQLTPLLQRGELGVDLKGRACRPPYGKIS